MQRKIIQIGNSTQLISLPRKWALKHDIKKGEPLEVMEEGNKIIISSIKGATIGKIDIDVSELDRDSLMFLIRALYKNGYDEIKLNCTKTEIPHYRLNTQVRIIDVISKEITRLHGMDLFSQKEDYFIIKNIADDSPKALDNMLRRIFLLTIESMNDLHIGLKKNDNLVINSVQLKHDNITKFIAYSQRIINKFGYDNKRKSDTLYHILEIIDEIVDLVKFQARLLEKFKSKITKDPIQVSEKIAEAFGLYYKMFYNFDQDIASEITKIKYEIFNIMANTNKNTTKNELIILIHNEQIVEKIINLVVSTMSFKY
jgi:phosphate uptake regulator